MRARRTVVFVAILLVGALVAVALVRFGPRVERVPEPPAPPLVRVLEVQPRDVQVWIDSQQALTGEEFARLPLIATAEGARLRIGDIATVRDTFADTGQAARFDGARGALVRVFRVGDQDAIDIAQQVKACVEEQRRAVPESIRMTIWLDTSRVLQSRIDLLVETASSASSWCSPCWPCSCACRLPPGWPPASRPPFSAPRC